jgi:hypothetical protein
MRSPAALLTTFDDPDEVTEVYLDLPPADGDGEFEDAGNPFADVTDDTSIFDLLDRFNDCPNPGGHEFVMRCGAHRCVHCTTTLDLIPRGGSRA